MGKLLKKFMHFYQEQDAVLFWSISISVLMALLLIFLWAFFYNSLPKQIPLFYSLPWGDLQFGSLNQFLLLPTMIVLVILINLIITWHLHLSQILIKRMLSVSTSIISFLISIAALKIIFTFL